MQQPIYWPAVLPNNSRTYQKAFDSIKLKSSQGGHPNDNQDDIFGKGSMTSSSCNLFDDMSLDADDRVNDYQHYGLDAVQSCSKYPDMGAQVITMNLDP